MSTMSLADLEGVVIGPETMRVTSDQVLSYVEVTGDQPGRWGEFAPPSMAGAALFAVAPTLLSHPAVMAQGGAAIHGEQIFVWEAPLPSEAGWRVEGRVNRVRHRRGVWFVDFAFKVADEGGGAMVEGNSSFLIGGGQPPGRSEVDQSEPHPHHRGFNEIAESAGTPAVGSETPRLAKSASRADLIRYAAVTRDWNPIHWDHETAVEAGLSGVVVHGLACAAWLSQGVTRLVGGNRPLRRARFRFRQPLRPGVPAHVEGKRTGERDYGMHLQTGGRALIKATMETVG
jgi:acyl dehydratase